MTSVKTAISLDAKLYGEARELARELGVTRSRLFGLAIEDFIQRRRNKQIFDQLNSAYAGGPDPEECEMLQGGLRLFRKVLEQESAEDDQC